MGETSYVPPSEEILTEQVFEAIRWVLANAPDAPKPVYQVSAAIPLLDPETIDEHGTGEVWGVIRLHATTDGEHVVFESPWMTCELDKDKIGRDDEWWKELGL